VDGHLERFAELVRRPEADLPLGAACLSIGAHLDRSEPIDVDHQLGHLDELAAGVDAPDLGALIEHLFGRLGFRGDTDHYRDPANSFLHRVLERRLGIPITLSVLTLEVGHRVGVALDPVGMPGHFLLRDRLDPDVFVDPFSGGATLSRAGCERLFSHLHDQARFAPHFLDPTPSRQVVVRVLANLRASYVGLGDRRRLVEVQRLATLLPGAKVDDRRALAAALARTGRFDEAAAELEDTAAAAGEGGDGDPGALRAEARRFRARLN